MCGAIRRHDRRGSTVLTFDDVSVDLSTQRTTRGGKRVDLTVKEQALLVFFLRHVGEVLSRTRIYEQVWDERYDGLSNTLEVHVKELRRKLERLGRELSSPRADVVISWDNPIVCENTILHDITWAVPAPGVTLVNMTLVTRLSLFFLTALALVLVGMSASIYLIVRSYLLHELDERFDDTFETLTSVAEFGPHGVYWDPTDRRLDFGHDPAGDTAAWQVAEPNGRGVGISDESFAPLFAALPAATVDEQLRQNLTWRDETWRVMCRTVHPETARAPEFDEASPAAADQVAPSPSALIMSVAVPMSAALAPLRTLRATLAGISLTVWLALAFAGKWLSRKALRR